MTSTSTPASGTEQATQRYYAEAWTRHVGEGGGTAYAVFDRTTGTFAEAEAGGFYSAFETLASAEAKAAELNIAARMRELIAEGPTGVLLDHVRILIRLIAANPNDPAMPTYKLTRSLLVNELAARNPQIEEALDAWAADPEAAAADADEIVLRLGAQMDPATARPARAE